MYVIRNTPAAIKKARELGASVPNGANGEAWYKIPTEVDFDWGNSGFIDEGEVSQRMR